MILRALKSLSPYVGWAVASVSAMIGTYASSGAWMAVLAGCAMVLYCHSTTLYLKTRNKWRHYKDDCAYAEWAHRTALIVTDNEGSIYHYPLYDLRWMRNLHWLAPIATSIYNAEHEGGTDGEPGTSLGRDATSPLHAQGDQITPGFKAWLRSEAQQARKAARNQRDNRKSRRGVVSTDPGLEKRGDEAASGQPAQTG